MVAASISNPILNLFLIRYFQAHQHNGAVGAAISLLVTEIGMALAGLVLLPPLLDSRSAIRLLRAVVATLGMAIVVWLVASHFGLLLQVASGAGTFAVLVLLLRVLSAEELEMVNAVLGRVGAKLKRQVGRS